MNRRISPPVAAISVALVAGILLQSASHASIEDRIWQHRNLGKAFYENPTTGKLAVEEFRKALELNPGSFRERLNYGLSLIKSGDLEHGMAELKTAQSAEPKIPHTWFNLAVCYKLQHNVAAAIEQFEGAVRLAPGEPVSHYNLGLLYSQRGDLPAAVAQFEKAAQLDSAFAAPRVQLFSAYRSLERNADAQRVMAEFRAIKARQDRPGSEEEDVNWSVYSEIYDPVDDRRPISQHVPRNRARPLAGTVDAATAGTLAFDFDGDGRTDLLAWSDLGLLLYRRGTELVDRGLGGVRHVRWVAAGDYDNDGRVDLAVVTSDAVLLFRNGFEPQPLPPLGPGFRRAVWIDYDHDGDLDLVLLGDRSVLLRNDGAAGWEDRTRDFPFISGAASDAAVFRSQPDDTKAFDLLVAYGNRNVLYRDRLNGRYEPTDAGPLKPRDVRPPAELAVEVSSAGKLRLLEDRSTGLSVELEGVKSLKIPTGAEIEVRSGAFYARKRYETSPVTFHLGDRRTIDAIRITWPNGMIQNELHPRVAGRLHFKEAPRLAGSCPMIYTWNGREFQFITDVLGVAPLGATSGDGSYFPVDHDEYVFIDGASLAANGGRYELRITEELSEVSYLDEVRLLAVDHPSQIEVFTNDKWKGPPYPEFRLFGVARRVYPRTARDGHGRNVLPELLRRDRAYVDGFARDAAGVAEWHTLDLDFGSTTPAVLILTGWVDWADGSTFLKAAQTGRPLVGPSLQVKDAAGKWRTVIEDMGMPSGKTKTIAVDLTGKFLSASREIRIVTNMCVYWDEIFAGETAGPPEARMTAMVPVRADLRFRGFSRAHIDPARRQPESFDYAVVAPFSQWNPTPGLYTRFGEVRELVREADDRMVVMGSGDELQVAFDAAAAGPLPTGWKRDFLLLVDGWAKDADANTAFSQTVEPLPFHGMRSYPYDGQSYPEDAAHDDYRRIYNTRTALKLIRSLTPTMAEKLQAQP